MKNRLINIFTLMLIMLLAGVIDASAAVYTWSRYNLTFETPDGGFVTFNSSNVSSIHQPVLSQH